MHSRREKNASCAYKEKDIFVTWRVFRFFLHSIVITFLVQECPLRIHKSAPILQMIKITTPIHDATTPQYGEIHSEMAANEAAMRKYK